MSASAKSRMPLKTNRNIQDLCKALAQEFPDAKCALNHRNPFELLIATILSAQCTDKRVNLVTPKLFERFPDPSAFAASSPKAIEPYVQSTGFFRQKAKSIFETSKALVEKHGGQVPPRLEDLIQLRGVARKTANVVLGDGFRISVGIVVDTHVKRITRLLGLTRQHDPVKIEKDLCKIVPKEHWISFSHWIILHGRKTCIARRPKCSECPILGLCARKGLKALPKPKKTR
jgi:endonuclease III